MAGPTPKRRHSSRNALSNCKMEDTIPVKRSKISKADSDSNSESVLSASRYNYTVSESDATSDSEFEDHPYSKQKKMSIGLSRPIKQSLLDGSCGLDKRTKRPSRNAINARVNRLKKKMYVEGLEAKNAELLAENEMLKDIVDSRLEEIASLKRETVNLRNIIRNSTEIGKFLHCIHENTKLKISSSLIDNKALSGAENLQSINSVPATQETCTTEADTLPTEEEALISTILWGMALHTFCQPYKRNHHTT